MGSEEFSFFSFFFAFLRFSLTLLEDKGKQLQFTKTIGNFTPTPSTPTPCKTSRRIEKTHGISIQTHRKKGTRLPNIHILSLSCQTGPPTIGFSRFQPSSKRCEDCGGIRVAHYISMFFMKKKPENLSRQLHHLVHGKEICGQKFTPRGSGA